MKFSSQVSRALDEEHRHTLELLAKVEQAFTRTHRGKGRGPELAKLTENFARHIELDLGRHFDFEERELFPRFVAAGEGDIAELLTEEHASIHQAIAEFLPLAHAAAAGTLDDAGWDKLKRSAFETVERLTVHIHKETVALLPMVDDLLDEEADRELSMSYASA